MEPKEDQEVEVTPEMIEAGLLWLYRFSHEVDEREIVAEIYKAMKSVKENSCSKLHVLK